MLSRSNKVERLYHHAFATSSSQLLPPGYALSNTLIIGNINEQIRCCQQHLFVSTTDLSQCVHMPAMVFVSIHMSLGSQNMERSQFQIGHRLNGPTVVTICIDITCRQLLMLLIGIKDRANFQTTSLCLL